MTKRFRRLFEGPHEYEYVPDPFGRLGQGSHDVKDPTHDEPGMAQFQEFRDAWNQGEGITDLFGKGALDIQAPVTPEGVSRRPDVAKIETMLADLGQHDASQTDGPTGYYGTRLEESLKDYQTKRNLNIDGIVNPNGETLEAMKRDLVPVLAEQAGPPRPPAGPRPGAPRPGQPPAPAALPGGVTPGQSLMREVLGGPLDGSDELIGGAAKDLPGKGAGSGKPAAPAQAKGKAGLLGDQATLGIFGQPAGADPQVPHQVAGTLIGDSLPDGRPLYVPAQAESDFEEEDENAEARPASGGGQGDRPSAGASFLIDFANTLLGAQQRTNPNVIAIDGTYNYRRAPEGWQRYFQHWRNVDQNHFVVLFDPITQAATVWIRDPEMEESPFLGFGRIFSFNFVQSLITKAPQVARAARAAGAVVGTRKARLGIAGFLRNADKTLDATTPREMFTPAIWDKLPEPMRRLIITRFPYFTGRAAELKIGVTLEKAGFTIKTEAGPLRVEVIVNGTKTTRIYDQMTNEQIVAVLKGLWVRKPASKLPTGVEVKFASSPILKIQRVKDAAAKDGEKIVEAMTMRAPADRVSKRDLGNAILEWLNREKGSRVLTKRQKDAFYELVGVLQKRRMPDGTFMTIGGAIALGIALGLKLRAQPSLPEAPAVPLDDLLHPNAVI